MTTYSFPAVTPNESSLEIVSNVKTFKSPISGTVQTIDRGGEFIVARLVFRALEGAARASMIAWLAKLNGTQHRFTLHNHAEQNRGAFGGTPLVAGAAQTGNSLDIDGCATGVTNWIRAGDFFSVNGELKICTADANSSGGGLVTIAFAPRLHTAPANNDPLTTSGGTGVFMLDNPRTAWTNRPGNPGGHFSDVSIVAVEDVVA